MSRRHTDNCLKSPQSLSGRSIHLTLVTKWSRSWSWMTYCHPLVQCLSALPFWDTAISKFDHENPWSSSCVWSKIKVTFDLQNSKVKVMVKVKPIDHIWGLQFNRYVCFSFRGSRTIFGWDIANSIIDLQNSRSRLWPRSNLIVKFEAFSSIDVCFLLGGNRTIFGSDITNSIFDLENSRSRSQRKSNQTKSNQVIYRSGPTIVPKMKEIQKVVQKLSREQESMAGGVRTGTKT